MKIGGSAQTQHSTQSSGPDAATQAYVNQIRQAAQGAGAAGPGAPLTGASGYYTGVQGAGATGAAALGGDPTAVSKLMNPYQQQVIDAMNKQLGVTNAQTNAGINANATLAGAFGGDRAAVASGAAQSANDVANNAQIAQLLSGGYSQAMQTAATGAALGNQAAAGNTALGQMGVGNPQLWQMMMLQGGLAGTPYGTQGTSNSNQAGGSVGIG